MADAYDLEPGLSPSGVMVPNPYDGITSDDIPQGIRSAVHFRDENTCRACGFRSQRFMSVQAVAAVPLLPEDYVTLCRACWMIENLDRAAIHRSASFAWIPELTQREINSGLPLIYIERQLRSSTANAVIKNLLDTFKARSDEAHKRLGAKGRDRFFNVLSDHGKSHKARLEGIGIWDEGLRIWPLDRWIEHSGPMEYNSYPMMISHWRKSRPATPHGDRSAGLIARDWLTRMTS